MKVLLVLAFVVGVRTDVSPCLLLPSALSDFLVAISAPSTLDYTKADQIESYVNWKLANAESTQDLVTVCNARQAFYNELGTSYEQCINAYAIYGLGNSTIGNARVFEHIFRQLQFMCAAGFTIWTDNRDCITQADSTSTCFNEFNITVHIESPVNLCGDSTQGYLNCVTNDYTAQCNNPIVGWFACERERLGWSEDCLTVACDVIH